MLRFWNPVMVEKMNFYVKFWGIQEIPFFFEGVVLNLFGRFFKKHPSLQEFRRRQEHRAVVGRRHA